MCHSGQTLRFGTLGRWMFGVGWNLCPAFVGDNAATWVPLECFRGAAKWLDVTQVQELEPDWIPTWLTEDGGLHQKMPALIPGA
jgi:hypothetical protein